MWCYVKSYNNYHVTLYYTNWLDDLHKLNIIESFSWNQIIPLLKQLLKTLFSPTPLHLLFPEIVEKCITTNNIIPTSIFLKNSHCENSLFKLTLTCQTKHRFLWKKLIEFYTLIVMHAWLNMKTDIFCIPWRAKLCAFYIINNNNEFLFKST